MSVPCILRSLRVRDRYGRFTDDRLAWRRCALQNAHKAMQRESEMRHPYGLDHSENNYSLDFISGRVLAMGFEGADVEIGNIAGARLQRRGQLGQKRPTPCC